MIEIKDLVKTYKTKNKREYLPLGAVNLTLPDRGLVFLLGKSGSGKSTFLNLLGGLDSPTSGSILVDGKELSALKPSQLAAYRNESVGFVFQDYCLIDDLTVYDNVAAALELKGERDDGAVDAALKTVGLEGYADKYPMELSGGERQRTAIARAIIKNPRIILADEPTGNLDEETAETIFDLLQTLAKESLVFVVSHDKSAAKRYAHRTIVLENGKIVADEGNTPDSQERNRSATEKAPARKGQGRIGWLFLKSRLLKIGLYSLMVAMIMVVMMLAQTIMAFEPESLIKKELTAANPGAVFLTKTLTDAQREQVDALGKVANSFPEIRETDVQAFRDAGYEGTIYPVYKSNIHISQSHIAAAMATNVFDESLYILEPLGVMVVDEAFLKETYGKLEYAASAEQFHPSGVVITDYLADIILQSGRIEDARDYSDLIGVYRWGSNDASRLVSRGYINGILRTDYRETYRELLEEVEKYGAAEAVKALQNEEFLRLAQDIHTKYGFCYSLNPDFERAALETPAWDMVWHYALRFGDGEPFTTDIPQVRKAETYGVTLQENEVLMELTAYNKAFHRQYTPETLQSFTPHTETLRHYLYADLGGEAKFTQTVTIAGLFVSDSDQFSGTLIAGTGVYEQFAKSHSYATGLYFAGGDIRSIGDTAAKRGFQSNLIVGESLRTMAKVVEIFVPIFRLMAAILCVAVVCILMNFATKMIQEKMREIGILKAIGAKNGTIGRMFGGQILLIALVTAVLSVLGYGLLIGKTNDLLIRSLQMVASGRMISDLPFLTFRPGIAVQNCLLILLLSLVSCWIPMYRIRKLDPVKIIRTEE